MFCSLSAFASSVWISEQEAIISLPNMLVFVAEIQCLLPGTICIFSFVSCWYLSLQNFQGASGFQPPPYSMGNVYPLG